MTLVTVHLAPGQTLKELVQEVRALSGGLPVRTVAGRAGVLVTAELAFTYLGRRLGEFGSIVGESVGSDVEVVPDSRLSSTGVVQTPPEALPPPPAATPPPPAPLPGGAATAATPKTPPKSRTRKAAKTQPEGV